MEKTVTLSLSKQDVFMIARALSFFEQARKASPMMVTTSGGEFDLTALGIHVIDSLDAEDRREFVKKLFVDALAILGVLRNI